MNEDNSKSQIINPEIERLKSEIEKKDRKVIQGISNQVSTALEQARLYRESIDNAMELRDK